MGVAIAHNIFLENGQSIPILRHVFLNFDFTQNFWISVFITLFDLL